MAEAFGVATGAISIVSLALELSKVVKSTYRSVKLMQDVFANTAEIEIAFSTVEQLLNEIGRLSQSAANDCGVVVCLEQCRPRLQALKNIVQDIRESDSTNKGKIKKAFRALSYDHKISEASRLLNETVASLSLGLSVLQLEETRQQTIKLSSIGQTVAWIATQQNKRIETSRVSNDAEKRLIEDLSKRLASLETTINNAPLKDVRPSSSDSTGALGDLSSEHKIRSISSAFSTDVAYTPSKGIQTSQDQSDNWVNTSHTSSESCRRSNFLRPSEVYSITHRRMNLILGTMSVIHMKKKHKNISGGENDDSIFSWDVKINFTPSWCFDKGFWARLWTNAAGGCNLQQSLTVIYTVPREDDIWNYLYSYDVVQLRQRLLDKKNSVNIVDNVGKSLLASACRVSNIEMVQFLLDAGATTQCVDIFGRSPLLVSVSLPSYPYYFPTIEHWKIYNLLVQRHQMDPLEPDWEGQNYWHKFCGNPMDEMDFLWQSIIGDFYYNLNERDHEGRTALYILSLNPRSDLNLFTWHIRNQASISTPQVDGLTCLHGAILSLQPQQETSYVDLRRLLGRWVWNTSDRYDEKDRENQREKIELLICQGADVFAVSDQYGTPTDIARLTGNVSLWFDALRNSGLDPKATLAVDKKIPRHPRFQLTKQCARNLHRVRSLRWQRLQSIFSVIDDFDGEKGRSIDSAILEWDNLPNALNIVHIGTCSGIIDILGAALGSMISRYPLARIGEGLLVKCEHLECGEYRKVFNDSCYYDATVPLQCMMELTDLVHYLRVFAEIATGDCVLRAGEIDWKLHWRYVTILKAAAQLQLNCTSLLPLPAGMLKYPTFDDAEAMAIMPGSWPADQEPL